MSTPDPDTFPCGCLTTTGLNHFGQRTILYANRYFYDRLGCTEESLVGNSLSALLTPASCILVETFMLPMLKQKGHCDEILLEVQQASGDKIPVVANVSIEPGYSENIAWSFFNAVQRNKLYQELVELRRAEEEKAERFEALSGIDELTGLINRRKLYERSELVLAQARRSGKPVAMLMMDIDHFKIINDSMGHVEGDRILEKLGTRLREQGRETDIIARYGGEEFVIMLPDANKSQARSAAQRLHAIANQIKVKDEPLTVSIGVSYTMHNSQLTFQNLFQTADAALYQAKDQGRNRTCVLPATSEKSAH